MTVLALSDIKGGRELIEDDREGYDLVFVLDISRSMLAGDESPNRLGRAVQAVRDIVEQLSDARFGVVAFKGEALPLLPLTRDREALTLLLDAAGPELATSTGTNLQAGLAAALEAFTEGGRYRAIFLLSDGEGLDGDATRAARMAGQAGIPIICLGFGSEDGETLVIGGRPVTNAQGRPVTTRLDRAGMTDIAEASGGRYYRSAEIRRVGRELLPLLKGLQEGDFSQGVRSVKKSLYRVFVSLALLFLTLSFAVRSIRWRDTL
jgi:Ca-activated chloride channel family protein